MLKSTLHRIVAIPRVYDLIQIATGSRISRSKLARQLTLDDPHALVVDVGGGTGLNRALLPPQTHYICLDNDPVKLAGFRVSERSGVPLLGDARVLPFAEASVDMLVCSALTHHLPDDVLRHFLAETMRVLKPGGRFVLLDAVWEPLHPTGRLLWRYDRGSYPRPAPVLRAALEAHGQVVAWDEYIILHRYVIAVLTASDNGN